MRMEDSICALSTPQGMGAIALIRLSGPESFTVFEQIFEPFSPRHDPKQAEGFRQLFGKIRAEEGTVDEVMAAVFRAPHSYTGEDVIEISCHGSVYIQDQIIRLLLSKGLRMADPGEFTLRAYINGKLDLSQAEAVADLISSENKASHQVAMQQMRGGFSQEIRALREELIRFASLLELELDFGEEDVEFADRAELTELLSKIQGVIQNLMSSYDLGNVIKHGVSVAIVGAPNVGKSTLLNALLNEERAIVTEIAGTTRDTIEDEINLAGVKYRFIDTAGIRETEDKVESIGIEKTFQKIAESKLTLYLFEAPAYLKNPQLISKEFATLQEQAGEKQLIAVANKADLLSEEQKRALQQSDLSPLLLSALTKEGVDELIAALTETVNLQSLQQNESIVTNARHFQALQEAHQLLQKTAENMAAGLSGDLIALDIRYALQALGSIIGEVDFDQDILGSIFSKFCIGK